MKIKEIEISTFHEMTVNLGNYNSTKFGESISYKVEVDETDNVEDIEKKFNEALFAKVKANVASQVIEALKKVEKKV